MVVQPDCAATIAACFDAALILVNGRAIVFQAPEQTYHQDDIGLISPQHEPTGLEPQPDPGP